MTEQDALDAGKDRPVTEHEHPIHLTLAEWQKAVAKFPTWPTDPFHALTVVGEEVGELNKALLQYVYETEKGVTMDDIREEAVQAAAMCLRWIASIDRYVFSMGDQHDQPMMPIRGIY